MPGDELPIQLPFRAIAAPQCPVEQQVRHLVRQRKLGMLGQQCRKLLGSLGTGLAGGAHNRLKPGQRRRSTFQAVRKLQQA
jgi:hypothetical protein